MARLTREEILARKLGNDVVTLPGGGDVEVRALTFREVERGQKIADLTERTAFYVSIALVDPKMSAEEVAKWADEGEAGDLTHLSEQIQQISRLSEGAGKSGVRRTRKR